MLRYYLQIDSHMRFAHHWDDFLISELRACPSNKPVISTYPPGYKGQGNPPFPLPPLPPFPPFWT